MISQILTRLIQMPGARALWKRYPSVWVPTRVRYGIWSRPHYAYGVFAAAKLAKRLGYSGISAIEFGVAGGNGLLALEEIAKAVGQHFGIPIGVWGFDTGQGMPEPADFRDLPHVWGNGFYRMDVAALQARLTSAKLLLGGVTETVPKFLDNTAMLPVGFVAFDLDYYSSTAQALRIFDGGAATRLPRVFCYFDDIIWPETACHNEHVGELCAIRDFNSCRQYIKLSPLHLLRHMRPYPEPWNDQIYVLHDFQHPLYCTNITPQGDVFQQKPLQTTQSAKKV
jgi:hypothetical protein